MSTISRSCKIAAAAVVVVAAVASFGVAAARADDSVERGARASELIARLTSDSWSVRQGAQRGMRAAPVDDAAMLRALAAHTEASVRVAAIDVLSQWTRSTDASRSKAGREALAAIASGQHDGAKLAASRLDALVNEIEESVMDSLTEFSRPLPVFT